MKTFPFFSPVYKLSWHWLCCTQYPGLCKNFFFPWKSRLSAAGIFPKRFQTFEWKAMLIDNGFWASWNGSNNCLQCWCYFTSATYSSFQKKLQDVSVKFRLFQKPANFEQRLQECKRILDEVKLQVPKLETKSVEQEVVQSHLDHCMVNTLDVHFLSILSSKRKVLAVIVSI